MAKKADLMGMGMPPFVARRLAKEPNILSATGATLGDSLVIGGDQYLISLTGSVAGQPGIKIPAPGGDSAGQGALLGDEFVVNNQNTVNITVYVSNGATISQNGVNTAGATGVSVSVHKSTLFYWLTATSVLGISST